MLAAACNRCKSTWYQLCQYCHEYAKSNQGDCKINLICASYEPYTKRRTPAKVFAAISLYAIFDLHWYAVEPTILHHSFIELSLDHDNITQLTRGLSIEDLNT
jgi:hypothetical protein